MSKMKIGIFGLTTCVGDQIVISNCKDQLQDIVDIVSFSAIKPDSSIKRMDIALVEGQVSSQEDLDLLKRIRENTKYLVALGTCACEGGVWAAIEEYGIKRSMEVMHLGFKARFTPLDEPGSLDEFVEVDYYIRGCPVRSEDILYLMNKFAEDGINKNEQLKFPVFKPSGKADSRSIITLNRDKCILCRRCDYLCNEVLGIHAIGVSGRGSKAKISTPLDISLDETNCIYCGQCIASCPVGAFDVRSSVETALKILEDDANFVVAVIDPVAVSSAVESSLIDQKNIGIISRKMISALKDMGADKVINFFPYEYFSAVAQAELVSKKNEVVFALWCSSARDYLKKFYPRYMKYVHEEISPEALLLKHVKNRYGKERLKILLMTPCISKKRNKGFDAVLMSKEIPFLFSAKDTWLDMYHSRGVSFDDDLGIRERYISSDDHAFNPLIMRIAYQMMFGNSEVTLTTKSLENGVFEYSLKGKGGSLSGLTIKRLSKSREYLKGKISQYNMIEMITCPNGCMTGGGQYPTVSRRVVEDRIKRFRSYGEATSPTELIPEIIDAYSRLKGVI